jgi:hypothetical protein
MARKSIVARSISHHGLASARKRVAQKRERPLRKLPRVISLRFAKKENVRHGIALYSNVQSRSRGTRIIHVVTGTKLSARSRRFRLHCSCEAKSFNPRAVCIHQQSVNLKLTARRNAGR